MAFQFRTTASYKSFRLLNGLFMILVMVVCLYPFLHVLAVALNNGVDTMRGGLSFYPRKFTLLNFTTLLKQAETLNAAAVSFARVIVGVVIGVLFRFGAGYAMAKKDLCGKGWLMAFFMVPMFFGAGIIPQYVLYARLGLLGNFWVYIWPYAFSTFHMLVIRTYLLNSIPESIEESAKLDGANEIDIFFRLILPLSKPVLATVALWLAVDHWNDWTTTLIFAGTNRNIYTLQFLLQQFIQSNQNIARLMRETIIYGGVPKQVTPIPDSYIAAQTIIATLPIVLVFPFVQKYFVKGVMFGSLKE